MNLEWAFQKAVYDFLSNRSSLETLLGGPDKIVDAPPNEIALPYIMIGDHHTDEADVTPTDSDNGYGLIHRLTLHVWSSYEGKKEVAAILANMRSGLRDNLLPMDEGRLVRMRCGMSDHFADPDGQGYHGVQIWNAHTEEN